MPAFAWLPHARLQSLGFHVPHPCPTLNLVSMELGSHLDLLQPPEEVVNPKGSELVHCPTKGANLAGSVPIKLLFFKTQTQYIYTIINIESHIYKSNIYTTIYKEWSLHKLKDKCTTAHQAHQETSSLVFNAILPSFALFRPE